jgi:hypothetical protein
MVVVLAALQERVDGHRHGADPDRPPEGRHHHRRVVEREQDALFPADAEFLEVPSGRAGEAVQLAIGHRSAGPVDGDLVTPAGLQVAVEQDACVVGPGHQEAISRLAKSVWEMSFTNAFGSRSGRSTAVSKTNA